MKINLPKKIFLVILVVTLAITLLLSSPVFAWQDVCGSGQTVPYCKNVGKMAHNLTGGPKGVKLGKIVGVAWRVKGSLVSKSGRTAKRDAYYYIIDDGMFDYPFIRMCREIEVR